MDRPTVDYQKLIAQAVSDPAGAFRIAVDSDDVVGLAFVSIAEPGNEPATAVGKLNAFISHAGATSATAELILGILEQAEHLADDLAQAVNAALRERLPDLPMDDAQTARAEAVVSDADSNDESRSLALAWISIRDKRAARKKAIELLKDVHQAYGPVSQQALVVIGAEQDSKARAVLKEYAERHLEPGPPAPTRQADAAFYALNSIARPRNADVSMVNDILARAAASGLSVGNNLRNLFRRLAIEQVSSAVQQLRDQGHAAWLATQFVPALIGERAADIAPTVGEEWWPAECRGVFASTDWKQHDDRLYTTVLEGIHKTDDEPARTEIRQRIAQRCQATSSTATTQMPRIGIRALLKLALNGEIPPTDPSLITALQAADSSVLEAELSSASWKSPDRAHRLGQIVAQLELEILLKMVGKSLAGRPQTALALMSGASSSLDGEMEHVLEMVDDNEAVLTGLCELSEEAAHRTLERWNSEHSIVAFRALRSSKHAQARLLGVPAAVRLYKEINEAERAELLATYGPCEDRVEVLASILEDRSNAGPRPSDKDVIGALTLLGEHLAGGLMPERVLETMGVICREVTRAAVRKAAYEALAKSTPTAAVVDLLREREGGEAASLRPFARDALQNMADRLDEMAGDPTSGSRAEAAELLARIDPARAVIHARELMAADEARDRILAAEILAAAGSDQDAQRLEAATSEEPSPEVRNEFMRAIRRLRIGDSAAAHERLAELADVSDSASWMTLDPNTVYGRWAGAIVTGLDRVARAESVGDFGTAIDQLDEVAKALLFRAIELAGDEPGISAGKRAKAATNDLDFGDVLGWQQLSQTWRWVRHFASLHELRSEHIAERGTVAPPPERSSDDLGMARSLFKLGARPCCDLIRQSVLAE